MSNTEFMIPENFAVIEADNLREECVKAMLEDVKDFIFNFTNCKFIDSTGLGVLVSIYKKCRENGGHVELVSVNNSDVLRVFKLTRLDEIFNI